MKNLICTRSLILYAFFCLCTVTGWSQSCYDIVGYVPSWQGDNAAIDYTKFTHLNYAFGIPNTNGTVGAIDNASKLSDLVSRGHATNTKVLLSIGGWLTSSPDNTPYDAIAQNSTSINTFVNTCANLVTQYNLDGIDIDWEYPNSQTNWNNIMNPLATRIHGMGKLLTAAVPANSYAGDRVGNLTILDLVNIMSYDCNCPTNAPYNEAVADLSYWAGRGVPVAKRILGVPFYSSDNTTSLHVQKAQYVKAGNGGGIMIWEITSPGDINAIASTLGTLCKGGSVPTNIASNKPVTASSTETGNNVASNAVDGNYNTRWSSTYADNQWIRIDLGANYSVNRVKITWEAAYASNYHIDISSDGNSWTTIKSVSGKASSATDDFTGLSGTGRYLRVWGVTRATQYGVSMWEVEAYGSAATSGNIALNKPVTTTSNENTTNVGSKAVDGNGTTRWSSGYADNQNFIVDLGANYNINRVRIAWEAAYATNYQIQVSTNNSTWTTIKEFWGKSSSAADDYTGLNSSARWVKIYCINRATAYGFSFWEFEVYGTLSGRAAVEENLVEDDNVTAFPNPVAGVTTIQVNLKEAGNTVVNVSGSVGNVIAELHNGQLDAGRHEFNFNTEGLKPGMYFYSVIHNGRRTTKKLLKQ
jgi:hypothetical protein